MTRLAALLGLLILITFPVSAAPGNRLAEQASPYLRLHASDPVHWRTWSADTLAAAKAANKPILLSIGYLACHWCHVMQKESYANAATAAVINEHFFPILIDREERPDLDHTFQHAALAMDLPTGWPLTLFLTPDAQPFYGGTYYPGTETVGMPAFSAVLTLVADAYREDPAALVADAARAKEALKKVTAVAPGAVSVEALNGAAKELLAQADTFTGGFGEAAKFPQTAAHEMLWRAYLRTGEAAYGEAVQRGVSYMADVGLYDHIDGGFYRYTVDPLWRVPHFEKMLDTNATVLGLMTEVWRETRDPILAERIAQTISFLLRDMRLENGALATALDADSKDEDGHEEEGAFYIWKKTDIETILGSDAEAFFNVFDLAPPEDNDQPNFGLPFRHDPGKRDPALEGKIPALLAKLKAVRDKRHRPRRDDKVLADWNGMAIRALAEAGAALGRTAWVAAAEAIFDAATKTLTAPDGRLHQTSAIGRTSGPATAAGLGQMALAALSLHDVTGKPGYLKQAETWANDAVTHHWDGKADGFFATADDAGPVPSRIKIVADNPNPGGNAVLLDALARLYYATGDVRWRGYADKTMRVFGGLLADVYPGVGGFANGSETALGALQIVIIGEKGKAGFDGLRRTVLETSLPARSLQVVAPGITLPDGHPAQYKEQIDGVATTYVCRGSVCSLPTVTKAELKQTLDHMRRVR